MKFYLPASGREREHASDPITDIRFEVYYSKGGMNPWSYENEPRGIWGCISPVTRKDHFECCLIGGGASLRYFIEAAPRLNRKRVAEVFATMRANIEAHTGKDWDVLQKVLARTGGRVTMGSQQPQAVQG